MPTRCSAARSVGTSPWHARLALALGLCGAPATAQLAFPQPVLPGHGAAGLTLAELDGDGRLDALGGNGALEVWTYRGDGAGGLAPATQLAFASSAIALAPADFDGDGDLDLAVGEPIARIDLRRNEGAGAFSALAPYFPPLVAEALVPGDLDGDGAPDLFALESSVAMASLLGDGAGGFSAQLLAGSAQASELALGDLDGDGLLDVAWTSQQRILWRHGDGSGGFGAITEAFWSSPPKFHLALGDLDLDGKTDIVTEETDAHALIALHNLGAGSFSASAQAVERGDRQLLLRDLGGDGRLDLLVLGPLSNAAPACGITVLLGLPGGALFPVASLETLDSAQSLAVGDLDANGALDLVAGAAGSKGALQVTLGSAPGFFALAPRLALGQLPAGIASADLDLDAAADLAIACSAPPALVLSRGAPHGPWSSANVHALASAARALACGDFDQDGWPDVALAREGGLVELWRGDGAGDASFASASAWPFTPQQLAPADFDADGRVDLAGWAPGDARVALAPGLGGAQLGGVALWTGALPLASAAVLRIGADAWPDVVACPGSGPQMVVLKSDGAFGFAQSSLAKQGTQSELGAGDVNGDGIEDLVQAGAAPVQVRLGNGIGGFGSAVMSSSAGVIGRPRVADLDADGRVDLVGAGFGDVERVLFGTAVAKFEAELGFVCGADPLACEVGDFDSDGRADVVLADGAGGELWFLAEQKALPAGATGYGGQTPGCKGALGLMAVGEPKVGASGFRVRATQAPRGAFGLAWVAAGVWSGVDPFGLGVELDVDLLSAPAFGFAWRADASGCVSRGLPVPGDVGLVGAKVYLQTAWGWGAEGLCEPSGFGLSTSRGLELVIGG